MACSGFCFSRKCQLDITRLTATVPGSTWAARDGRVAGSFSRTNSTNQRQQLCKGLMAHLADAKALLDNRGHYTGQTFHGVNPLLLVEKIIRERIFESLYWKEQAFGLNAATLLDRAVELTYIGGQYSNQRPTPFLCLTFKLLQLQPSREIILVYLNDPDFKYLRALAAFYIRLTWSAVDIYRTLEPLMGDYRKLKVRGMGGWRMTYVDEFVDELLTKERVCDIALPHIKTRAMLEDADELEPRESLLGSEVESEGESDVEEDKGTNSGDE